MLIKKTSIIRIAAMILDAEHGISGRQGIVIRQRGMLNATAFERFDTISVNNRLYNPLSYAALSPHGADGRRLRLQLQSISPSRL